MLIVIFTSAHLAVIPFNPEAAEKALAPFADEREARANGLTADDYSAACQGIEGQEFGIGALIEAGALDEDGNPTEGVVVLRAA